MQLSTRANIRIPIMRCTTRNPKIHRYDNAPTLDSANQKECGCYRGANDQRHSSRNTPSRIRQCDSGSTQRRGCCREYTGKTRRPLVGRRGNLQLAIKVCFPTTYDFAAEDIVYFGKIHDYNTDLCLLFCFGSLGSNSSKFPFAGLLTKLHFVMRLRRRGQHPPCDLNRSFVKIRLRGFSHEAYFRIIT